MGTLGILPIFFSASFLLLSPFPVFSSLGAVFHKHLTKPRVFAESFSKSMFYLLVHWGTVLEMPQVCLKSNILLHPLRRSPSSPRSQPIISPPLPKEQLYSAVIKYLIKHETSVPVFSSPAQASPWPSPRPSPCLPSTAAPAVDLSGLAGSAVHGDCF